MKKFRLAFLTSHPIQYQAPLFRKLAASPEIDLTVYFCSDFGLRGERDPGFGVPVKWDIPLLDGYPHVFLKNLSPCRSPEKFWGLFNPSVFTELKKNRPDALIVHGYAHAANWLAVFSAKILKIPVLFHGETVPQKTRGRLKKTALSRFFGQVSAFLCIGTQSRRFYEELGVPREKLFWTPYSVDNDFFTAQRQILKAAKSRLRASLGVSEKTPLILFAGKLIPRKRPMDLLRAFEPVQNKAALLFAGDGNLRGSLESYARSRGMRNVFFAGFKNQTEICEYYAAADLLVLPSEFETWGLVINEAMCFGLPVVTTSGVSAAADLVVSGKNGFVYEPGDVPALSGILEQFLHSPDSIKTQGRNSLEIISSWNHDQCVEGILESLRYVTGREKQIPGKTPDLSFSIIVPAYNEEEDLSRTLRCLENLHYPSFEVIVVDDGSADKTAEIAQGFVKRLRSFRLLRQHRNKGASAARNRGILEARGDVGVILNADVLLPPDFLQKISPYYREGKQWVAVVSRVQNLDRVYARFTDCEGYDFHFVRGHHWVWSEGFSCTRQAALKAGMFPEEMPGCSGEDWKFALDLENRFEGARAEEIVIYHVAPDRLSTYWSQQKGRGKGRTNHYHYVRRYGIFSLFLDSTASSLWRLAKMILGAPFKEAWNYSKLSPKKRKDFAPFVGVAYLREAAQLAGIWSAFFRIVFQSS